MGKTNLLKTIVGKVWPPFKEGVKDTVKDEIMDRFPEVVDKTKDLLGLGDDKGSTGGAFGNSAHVDVPKEESWACYYIAAAACTLIVTGIIIYVRHGSGGVGKDGGGERRDGGKGKEVPPNKK